MTISDIDSECLRFLMSSKVSGEELWANIIFKLDDAEGKNSDICVSNVHEALNYITYPIQ